MRIPRFYVYDKNRNFDFIQLTKKKEIKLFRNFYWISRKPLSQKKKLLKRKVLWILIWKPPSVSFKKFKEADKVLSELWELPTYRREKWRNWQRRNRIKEITSTLTTKLKKINRLLSFKKLLKDFWLEEIQKN